MNDRQVAFIICANNALYYDECVRYIEELDIPEGYSIDIFCIQEAESMAQGYNAGMLANGAKYKVYLHQNTFILNKRFIHDVIAIFSRDASIGMIGMIGTSNLPEDANCSLSWDIGCIETYDGQTGKMKEFFQIEDRAYIEVKAIEGSIMITQYDVAWREDFLDGWDFYDVSQSLEMQKKGYKIVVPYQSTPWCYYDGEGSITEKYDIYRIKMMLEYRNVFTGTIDETKVMEKAKEALQLENIRNNMILLLEKGENAKLSDIAEEICDMDLPDVQIREIISLMEIFFMEERAIGKGHSEWFLLDNWEQAREYYRWVRFVLLRIKYSREDGRIEEIRKKIELGQISKDAIRKLSSGIEKGTSEIYECLLKKVNKEEPLVSVVIAVYNGHNTIGDTLDSVLNQTYKNLEIIIVDDASTDNSREIIANYEDSRIKCIYLKENQHICYAGNIGFQHAKGKYVALIGHDDIWRENKLEQQVTFMEEHPSYSVCFTWADIIDGNKDVVNMTFDWLYRKFRGNNYKQDYRIRKLIFEDNHLCAPSACIRRDFLERTGYYRYGLVQLQDYDLWIRLLCEGPIYILQNNLTFYRRFIEGGKNLSAVNMEAMNRARHEKMWIQDTFVSKVPAEDFARIFRNDLKNPQACEEKEILCEKAFLLWSLRNCYAGKWFIDLLEDEECRLIFKEKYGFKLTDFYKINGQEMSY